MIGRLRDISDFRSVRLLRIACFSVYLVPAAAIAQVVTEQVPVGNGPAAVAVNPVTNQIYVANHDSDVVTVIDGATGNPTFIGVEAGPTAIAINSVTNTIYVANSGGPGLVSIINGKTNQSTYVNAGKGPRSLAVNPVTNKVYVANFDGNTVTAIDGGTNATTTIPVGETPTSVAVDTATNKIYVTNFSSDSVTVIDGATNTTQTIAVGTTPYAVAVNSNTNKIYVADSGSNDVDVIDGTTLAVTTVAAGSSPFTLAINPVTNTVYVANYNSANVTVINGANNSTSTISTYVQGSDYNPGSLAVNTITNQVYVANQSSSNLTLIDGATGKTSSIPTNGQNIAVALNSLTDRVYAANLSSNTFGTNNVAVIDGATNQIQNVALGDSQQTGFVSTFNINPVTNQIYINYGYSSGQTEYYFSVVNGSTDAVSNVNLNSGIYVSPIVPNTATNKAYTCDGNGNLLAIDALTLAVQTAQASKANPNGFECNVVEAVNPVTNTIYEVNKVVNGGFDAFSIFDQNTDALQNLPVDNAADYPYAFALDPATNTFYVGDLSDVPGNITGSNLTILDGGKSTATDIAVANASALAVNTTTNKIYVANTSNDFSANFTYVLAGNTITVIDAATNSTSAVITVPASAWKMAVNPITNKLYAIGYEAISGTANYNSFLMVIDGATNAVTSNIPLNIVQSGTFDLVPTVDQVNNKIYVIHPILPDRNNRLTSPYSGDTIVVDGVTASIEYTISGFGVLGYNSATSNLYSLYTPEVSGAAVTQSLEILSPQQTTPNPLTANVTPLPNNATSSQTPTFTFTATNAYGASAPVITNVYYQLDTWQGQWLAAAPSGSGFTASLPTIPLGTHTLYAWASNGGESTGLGTGGITAYSFTITAY